MRALAHVLMTGSHILIVYVAVVFLDVVARIFIQAAIE